MRNLFCISLKHMDNVSFQCWMSQIEIVECALQRGFKMCKIYNFEVANKTKCVKYIVLRLQIKFPRSVLNLTCIVHSPEVPAAIFWKHNGQVFFLLSYHIFTFFINTMYFLFKTSAPSSHFELRIFCSCSKSATMESRRWPETRCLPPSRSSHSLSLTQGRAESISAGE